MESERLGFLRVAGSKAAAHSTEITEAAQGHAASEPKQLYVFSIVSIVYTHTHTHAEQTIKGSHRQRQRGAQSVC